MGSINKVILVGNLGQDPVIRHAQSGQVIANLNIATSETWKDKTTGEKRQKTEWHRVVIFNDGLSRIAEKYLKKGSSVYIEGQLQTRKWQDKDGTDKWTTEIVLQGFNSQLAMLGGSNNNDPGYQPTDQANQQNQPAQTNQQSTYDPDLDDDIPF